MNKMIFLLFLLFSFHTWAQEAETSVDHIALIGIQTKTYNIEGINPDTNEKAKIKAAPINEYMLQYMWRMASWIEFRGSYRTGRAVMKNDEDNLEDKTLVNTLTEAKGGLWLKTGRQSSFLFEFTMKDDLYFETGDTAEIYEIKTEKVSFTSVTIEQIMYGVRTQGFGFRLSADLKANGADDIIKDRTGYGMSFFFRVEKDGSYLDVYAGGSQATKVTEEFDFKEQATFGGLNFGLTF
jgi:hypothetical protein